MKKSLALWCVLLCGPPLLADLKITGDLKLPPNRIVRLAAEGAPAGAAYIWDVDREGDCDLEEQGGRLLFAAGPGVYKVKVRSVVLKDGRTLIETARVVVTIGEPTPPPPPPPPPDDALAKTLRTAHAADADADKAKHAKSLAALYRNAPGVLDKAATAGDLYRILKESAAMLLPAAAVPNTRKAVAAELAAVLPATPETALTDMHKQQARSLFGRLAAALEAL